MVVAAYRCVSILRVFQMTQKDGQTFRHSPQNATQLTREERHLYIRIENHKTFRLIFKSTILSRPYLEYRWKCTTVMGNVAKCVKMNAVCEEEGERGGERAALVLLHIQAWVLRLSFLKDTTTANFHMNVLNPWHRVNCARFSPRDYQNGIALTHL